MSHVHLLLFQYEMWFSSLDVLADAQQTPDHLSDRLCSQSLYTIMKIWLQIQHKIIGSRSSDRRYTFQLLWSVAMCCLKLISDSRLCLKCHLVFLGALQLDFLRIS